MKVGTTGFVGARLTEAREAHGLTQIALADLLHVTRQAVSQYESGDASPAPDAMRRISEKLDLPIRFFLERPRDRAHGTKFFRSMKSTTKTARMRAARRFDWLLDVVDYVGSWIRFPTVSVPDFHPPSDPAVITNDSIAEFARETRSHWGLGPGPISNVTWLMEKCGIIVSRYGLGADELDAFSEWVENYATAFIVLNNEKQSAARSRFDLAHELGHLILHKNVSGNYINKPEYFNLIENQAHRFAGEFLLPEESFASEFYAPSLDAFASLQAKWKVSIAFMIQRYYDIGLIDSEQKSLLFRNRTRRGWRTREPFDDQMEPELPRLLQRSIEMLIGQGAVSADQMSFDLIYPVKEIEALTGLPSGFFQKQMANEHGGPETIYFPGVG
jgi:Zn-dependent peptidase ImmA (M78 family)/transcriptional regulator with XRE-family HTH domain